jgi:hypothetical protein
VTERQKERVRIIKLIRMSDHPELEWWFRDLLNQEIPAEWNLEVWQKIDPHNWRKPGA